MAAHTKSLPITDGKYDGGSKQEAGGAGERARAHEGNPAQEKQEEQHGSL